MWVKKRNKMKINKTKTEATSISRNKRDIDINIKRQHIKQVENLKYL